MNQKIINLLTRIKGEFDINDINDSQNLLLIIYNSMFIYEEQLNSELKYKIYDVLSYVIDKINRDKQIKPTNLPNIPTEDLYRQIVPFYLQNGVHQRFVTKRSTSGIVRQILFEDEEE